MIIFLLTRISKYVFHILVCFIEKQAAVSKKRAHSLTGKWPISDDTLSDTYMMLPSVVNATKKPSRAWKESEKSVDKIRVY